MRGDQQASPGDGPELEGRSSNGEICDLVNIPGGSGNNKKRGSGKRRELSAATHGGT